MPNIIAPSHYKMLIPEKALVTWDLSFPLFFLGGGGWRWEGNLVDFYTKP